MSASLNSRRVCSVGVLLFLFLKNSEELRQIVAGGFHSLALTADGELYSWGGNNGGQLGLGDRGQGTARRRPQRVGERRDWQMVAAGGLHTLALTEDGELYSWGYNYNGQLGLGRGDSGKGTDRRRPQRVGDTSNWQTIAAGESHSLALTGSDELYSWGDNGVGGMEAFIERSRPQRLGKRSDW